MMRLLSIVGGGYLLGAVLICAQSTKPLSFDVVSVKPHAAGDRATMTPPTILPGGRFVSKFSVATLISYAYKLPNNQSARLSGVPDWARGIANVYDVEATGSLPAGLSTQARGDRIRLMVQALLADRFKLAIHHESKEMPVYEIVVAKGGPKLEPSDIEEKDCPEVSTAPTGPPSTSTPMPDLCHTFNGGQGRGLHGRAITMGDVASYVENWTGRPLLDKTGLKGLYRIETKGWLPVESTQAPAPGAKSEDGSELADLPTLFEVFERMGLRLEAKRDVADVYVVDHIERPSEN